MNLFTQEKEENVNKSPLADRIRPRDFSEFVGQEEIIGKDRILRKAIEKDEIPSIIFWGPPGSGKTTLAQIIARKTNSHFVQFSAVASGLKDLRRVVKEAVERKKALSKRTILFVDEIHRWNKAQQDGFLPHVEKGTITLIGATTENPSFEIISPLLSRCRVFVLKQLGPEGLKVIINRALKDTAQGLGQFKAKVTDQAEKLLISASNGDARIILNALEIAAKTTPSKNGLREINEKTIEEALQHKALIYDKAGDEHFNVISAFIKSLRGSDPDAALYWLARMIEAGESPRFIVRRMVILASEDIGNADPQALVIATACVQAIEFVGFPEAQINLAQTVVYLAKAPKSNASYMALLRAKEDVKKTLNLPVPLHLRNAPTKLMKDLGYSKDYKYPHDYSGGKVKQDYLPEELKGRIYLKSDEKKT